MTQPPPFILVDGSYYLYRAFHAMSKADLRNADGKPTGAVQGVTYMLRRLKKNYPGSNITVIFDNKGKTFRNDIYSKYKAQRTPMPEYLCFQIQPIYKIIRSMGLSLLSISGVEADDVQALEGVKAFLVELFCRRHVLENRLVVARAGEEQRSRGQAG